MYSAILMVAVSGGVDAPALGGELKSKISNIGGGCHGLGLKDRLSGLKGKITLPKLGCKECTTKAAAAPKGQAAGKAQAAAPKAQAAGKAQAAAPKAQAAGKAQAAAPKAQAAKAPAAKAQAPKAQAPKAQAAKVKG